MKGRELLEEVFADYIEEYGEIELHFIFDEVDGVTNYNEELNYNSGWYNYYIATFDYKGKRYQFEYNEHTSDNVSDSNYYEHTFEEIECKIQVFEVQHEANDITNHQSRTLTCKSFEDYVENVDKSLHRDAVITDKFIDKKTQTVIIEHYFHLSGEIIEMIHYGTVLEGK